MPFNYKSTLAYQPLQQGIIEGASKSPFEIAGRAMTGLEDAMDNRIFNRELQGINSLEALNSMRVPQTKEAMAQFQQKQGMFTAINAKEQQDRLFEMQRELHPLQVEQTQNLINEQGRLFNLKSAAQTALAEDEMARGSDTSRNAIAKLPNIGLPNSDYTPFNVLNPADRASKQKLLDMYVAPLDQANRVSPLTYVEEFKNSSAWLANNPSLANSAEGNAHKTIIRRFENELRTGGMKDKDLTAAVSREKSNVVPYDRKGNITGEALAVHDLVVSQPALYTTETRKREDDAFNTAESFAQMQDIKTRMDSGIKSGKYKSGYLDSTADWMQSKTGSSFIKDATAGKIASELQTKLGVEGELAVQLGKVVKAAYGGNASNTDRETIAGAMSGMTSDDEVARASAFKSFNRSIRKLVDDDIGYLEDKGLYRSVEQVKKASAKKYNETGAKQGATTIDRPTIKNNKGETMILSEDGKSWVKQ